MERSAEMMMLITSHQQRLELLKPKHTQVNAEWPEIKVVARPDNLRRDAIFTSNGKKNFDSDFILKHLEKGIDISISQKMSPIKKQSRAFQRHHGRYVKKEAKCQILQPNHLANFQKMQEQLLRNKTTVL